MMKVLAPAVALVAAAVAGVSWWLADPSGDGVPQAAVPAHDLRLPIEDYVLSTDDHRAIWRAYNVAVERCAARRGVEVSLPEVVVPDLDHTERRYGLDDPVLARTHGYSLPRDDHSGDKVGSRAHELSRAQQRLVTGVCGDAARARLGLDRREPGAARRIDVVSVDGAREDPRVRAVFAAWRACMSQHGLDYDDPWVPPNDPAFRSDEVTPHEVRVAIADVGCKQQTGVVEVWHRVDEERQGLLLARERSALARIAALQAEQLARATAVLGDDRVSASRP
jgi:hypothetical protein